MLLKRRTVYPRILSIESGTLYPNAEVTIILEGMCFENPVLVWSHKSLSTISTYTSDKVKL